LGAVSSPKLALVPPMSARMRGPCARCEKASRFMSVSVLSLVVLCWRLNYMTYNVMKTFSNVFIKYRRQQKVNAP
jgi:hypothetical protein